MPVLTDEKRIEWLEKMARQPGGILLHSEVGPTGRTGIGLFRPKRSLRDAIDNAMYYRGEIENKS